MLGLLLIGNVILLGLQASGARRIATHTGQGEAALADSMLKAGGGQAAGAALTVVSLVLTPLFVWLLHIDSFVAALLVAPTLGCLTLMGSQLGVLQGGQSWTELAAVYTTVGVGRVIFGGGALLVHPSLTSGMVGSASVRRFRPCSEGSFCAGRPAALRSR